jgi:hypothetical protein
VAKEEACHNDRQAEAMVLEGGVDDKRRDEEFKYSPNGASGGGTILGCVRRCGNMEAVIEIGRPVSLLRRPRIDEGLKTENEMGRLLERSTRSTSSTRLEMRRGNARSTVAR